MGQGLIPDIHFSNGFNGLKQTSTDNRLCRYDLLDHIRKGQNIDNYRNPLTVELKIRRP